LRGDFLDALWGTSEKIQKFTKKIGSVYANEREGGNEDLSVKGKARPFERGGGERGINGKSKC